jgi:hypothetical protein
MPELEDLDHFFSHWSRFLESAAAGNYRTTTPNVVEGRTSE